MDDRVKSIIKNSCFKHNIPHDIIGDVVERGALLFTTDNIGPAIPVTGTKFKTVAEYVLHRKQQAPNPVISEKAKLLKRLDQLASSGNHEAFRAERKRQLRV